MRGQWKRKGGNSGGHVKPKILGSSILSVMRFSNVEQSSTLFPFIQTLEWNNEAMGGI